jgi:capsular polysaccharide export protein
VIEVFMPSSQTSPRVFRAAAVISRGILRVPYLQNFLPECGLLVTPFQQLSGSSFDVVIGWGHKKTSKKARAVALKNGVPYLALEDGFLRSVAPGVTGAPPLSVVVDDLGIYYDATTPSRLEHLLENDGWETEELLGRARKAMLRITRERLSKYNHAPDLATSLPGNKREKVLVVDQTFDDCSVTFGMADAQTFMQMLVAAQDENPEADIIVKTHPDVLTGKKRGYLTHIGNMSNRVHLLAVEVSPLDLIEKVDRVYTVTSQMGFEALLLEKPVECFGLPFYAGWGLTSDRQKIARRTRRRTLEELFVAAYILYPRYLNPYTNKAGTLEDVLDYLTLQVKHRRSLSGQNLLCSGFHWWKRHYLQKVLRGPANRVRFSNNVKYLDKVDKMMVWGDGGRSPLLREAQLRGVDILHMEDGFLRSVGLGSNLVRPFSLVLDSSGIYFDPTRPSDLETMLRETLFTEDLCNRAAALQQRIVSERFSKYNIGVDAPPAISPAFGQPVILVPGQVEDDASIRLGCVDIRTNMGLLTEVRRQNPDAYIIYKPHPDVLVGNRHGTVQESEVMQYCNHVVTKHSMPGCLDIADEVHTLTSLAGFEALLHGKKVVCYGLPFYAGWGLTQDRHTLSRRGRFLTVKELVAGALILYPRYIDWPRGEIIPVETALDRIGAEMIANAERPTVNSGLIIKWYKKITGFLSSLQ